MHGRGWLDGADAEGEMEWLFWGLSAVCFLAVAIRVGLESKKEAKAREEAKDLLIAALFVRTNVLAEAVNSHADAMRAISDSVLGGWEVTETLLKEREQRIEEERRITKVRVQFADDGEEKGN